MKKVLLAFMVVGITLISSCGHTQKEAIEYNNKIADIMKKTDSAMEKFYDDYDPEVNTNAARSKAIADIAKYQKELAALPDLKGGEKFKSSGLELLKAYENFFQTDLKKWLDARMDPHRTEESVGAARKVFDTSIEDVHAKRDTFEQAQVKFAQLYEFELK